MSRPFYCHEHVIEDEYGYTLVVTPYPAADIDSGPEIRLEIHVGKTAAANVILSVEAAAKLRDVLNRFIEGNPPQ